MSEHADTDALVRLRAFEFLDELRSVHGEALPRESLAKGFGFDGARVPLLGPQGIFKPSVLRIPLSITTVPIVEGRPRPYEDMPRPDGLIGYKYRGTDPMHRDNVGLREAMATATPLIYFYGLVPGSYEAAYPAFIVGEEPSESCFVVAVNDARQLMRHISAPHVAESLDASIRAYATTVVQRRLHQDGFRARVLQAYDSMCAVCRLRHRNLLDAAHILPDSHPLGDPWVSNGLALCKLHHAAFDQNILGIRPNLIVEIREDVLREKDGPMLMHGLQEMHGKPLGKVPMRAAKRPKEEFLAERYAIFRKAS